MHMCVYVWAWVYKHMYVWVWSFTYTYACKVSFLRYWSNPRENFMYVFLKTAIPWAFSEASSANSFRLGLPSTAISNSSAKDSICS